VPGEPGFTGMGLFVFYDGAGVRDGVVLQAPHPVFDGETLEECALAIPQVLPRVAMFAGTHRNNSTTASTCDFNGIPYRESDVTHHPDNFFHTTHVWLDAMLPDMLAVQFHGFCCPGEGDYAGLADDCVITNGIDAPTGPGDVPQVLRARVDAQNHLAGGVDLTTAAVFGDDTDVLGATLNLQGRVSNGVTPADACDTDATDASGRFVHIEQDPDVRDDPQHVVTALIEALDVLDAEPPSPCSAEPAAGCRQAAPGKAQVSFADSDENEKDRFAWKWSQGDATDLSAFSDPVGGSASYHVCVYDDSASPQPRMDLGVAAGGVCGTKPCWKAAGSKGFSYSDKDAASDGVKGLKLKSGAAGKASVRIKGAGAGLAVPGLPPAQPLVVQLLIDDGMTVECWQTTFTAMPLKSTSEKFRAKQ
jgi:hypothetical protein